MKYFLRYYEYSDQQYFKHTVSTKTMYCIYISYYGTFNFTYSNGFKL